MQASASQEQGNRCLEDHGKELSGSDAKEGDREIPEEETHALMDSGLFQPIQHDTRKKYNKTFVNSFVSFKVLKFKITPHVWILPFYSYLVEFGISGRHRLSSDLKLIILHKDFSFLNMLLINALISLLSH
jgi:hypothetical protein